MSLLIPTLPRPFSVAVSDRLRGRRRKYFKLRTLNPVSGETASLSIHTIRWAWVTCGGNFSWPTPRIFASSRDFSVGSGGARGDILCDAARNRLSGAAGPAKKFDRTVRGCASFERRN